MKFLKEWGIFLIIVIAALVHFGSTLLAPNAPMNSTAGTIQLWNNARVDGNSMDPTLADGQRLFMSKTGTLHRFDVIVAKETTEQTQKNDPSATSGVTIVKRIIGMPGDTITYKNDVLYINGTKTDEPYLASYLKLFEANQLADHYASLPLTGNLSDAQRAGFVQLAKNSNAFTTDNTGNPNFTVTVPAGHYFLIGDDRVVSADSRKVGSFSADQILGKVMFRFWPLNRFGGI
ncbi:MAG: signal peptidase I [Streptococcaceae bacterium]|jgi:signal peptidase I|nr:signal peptidase I [Streptococcaceae bacterium]